MHHFHIRQVEILNGSPQMCRIAVFRPNILHKIIDCYGNRVGFKTLFHGSAYMLPSLYQQGGCFGQTLCSSNAKFNNNPANLPRIVRSAREPFPDWENEHYECMTDTCPRQHWASISGNKACYKGKNACKCSLRGHLIF